MKTEPSVLMTTECMLSTEEGPKIYLKMLGKKKR